MSVKIQKFLFVLFLILSMLIIVSGVVNAAPCYVRQASCSSSPTNTCGATEILNKGCFITDVSDGTCTTDVTGDCSIMGCCCIGTSSQFSTKAFCDNSGGSLDTGVTNSLQCTKSFCENSGNQAVYNISGYIKKGAIPVPNVNITLYGITNTTDINGKYTFLNILHGYRSISVKNGTCNDTENIQLEQNTINYNISLNCLYVNVSGNVQDNSGKNVTSVVNVNAIFDGMNHVISSDANGHFNFNIPYNTQATIKANDSNGCTGSVSATTSLTDITNKNIQLSCYKYNVSGTISGDSGALLKDVEVGSDAVRTDDAGVYHLINMNGGDNVIIQARKITSTSNGITSSTETCTNSTSISLIGASSAKTGVDINLGINTCCNATQSNTACANCVWDLITTYTSKGTGCNGKTTTTQKNVPCTNLPPCAMKCDNYVGNCGIAGTVKQVCNESHKEITSNCNSDLTPVPLEAEIYCNSNCGNGIIDPGTNEECDYTFGGKLAGPTCISNWTSVFNSLGIDIDPNIITDESQKATMCNIATCKCMPTTPAPQPMCSVGPGDLSSLTVQQEEGKQILKLNWAMAPTCSDYIDHFELRMCNDEFGGCASGIYDKPVSNPIDKASRNYTDTIVQADTNYCYKLTVVFNESIPIESRTANITACNSTGSRRCIDGLGMTSWCDGNTAVSCQADNSLNSTDCSAGSTQKRCIVTNGVATCNDQALCDKCNELFGIFGYQGYIIKTGTPIADGSEEYYRIMCPSLQHRLSEKKDIGTDLDGCYMDYTLTTVDKAYSCSNVSTCYDYFSESSCETDYCKKFTLGLDNVNQCQWINQSNGGPNIFGKGICRPKDELEQKCGLCNDATHNRLDYNGCSQDTCQNLFGDCYLLSPSEKCVAKKDLTCENYTTPQECTGGINVSTNVQWLFDASRTHKISGDNSRTNSSDGGISGGIIGVCRWDPSAKVNSGSGISTDCSRDADNNVGLNSEDLGGKDCRMPTITNVTLKALLKSTCEHDTIAPLTKINNNSVYGILMNLSGQINITDNNPWELGDNSSCHFGSGGCIYTKLYYCLTPKDAIPCYPNITLLTTSDLPYVINLSALGITNANDGQDFTLYYFSEDPAKNLEYPIKNFTFKVDAFPPSISLNLSMKSFEFTEIQWLTNVSVTLKLNNYEAPDVRCTFAITPLDDDAALSFNTGYKGKYNIPSIENTANNKLTQDVPLSTVYPNMTDGFYHYDLTCTDAVGNTYQDGQDFNITGNNLINTPQPFMQKYNATSDILTTHKINISINTSVNGTCAYSTDGTYDDLKLFHTDNNMYHYDEVSVPLINATGTYKYFVICNLTINGVTYSNVRGSSMADPVFAIDDLAPITTLWLNDLSTNSPPNYIYYNESNYTYYDHATIQLRCNDSNPSLFLPPQLPMDFGCNDTYYCLVTVADPTRCDDINGGEFKSYAPIAAIGTGITFDYTRGQKEDKIKYGKSPTIYYYSVDNGGNSDPTRQTTLHIKNKYLPDPQIYLISDSDKNTLISLPTAETAPIDASAITILVNYSDRDKASGEYVDISKYNLTITNKNGVEIPLTVVGGETTGETIYQFYSPYVENGDYNFTITGIDDDNNTNTYDGVTFTIQHNESSVKLISPKLGIGTTPSYNITVSTNYPSDCKYSQEDITECNGYPTACRWNITNAEENGITSAQMYNPFPVTGSTIHTLTYNTQDVINSGEDTLYVLCKTVGSSDSDDSFAMTSFHVGYNDSNPNVNITFIQNPLTWPEDNSIINNSYNATTLQVFTDQPSVCTISSIDTNKKIAINPPETLFSPLGDDEDYSSYDKYYTVHQYLIDYKHTGAIDKTTYAYTINCTSRAQLETIANTNVLLNVNTLPPVMKIIARPNEQYYTLHRYDVTCDGLCMNEAKNTYWYKIIPVDESCEGTDYIEQKYSLPIEAIIPPDAAKSKICVRGYDLLERMGENSTEVNLSDFFGDGGPIVITYPYAYTYSNMVNRVYSPTQEFVFRISTLATPNIDATCKIIPFLYGKDKNNLSEIYDIDMIQQNVNYTFRETGSDTHNTSMNITSNENSEDVWELVCLGNDLNPDNTKNYFGRELFFYWDSTAPGTTVDTTPSNIYDWNNRLNTLIGVTTDDDTMCALNLTKSTVTVINKTSDTTIATEQLNDSNADSIPIDIGEPYAFSSYINYSRAYNYLLPSKWVDLDSVNINATYNFYVDCWNRAELTSTSSASMLYNLDSRVIINRTSGNVSIGTTIPVIISTNINSVCTANIDNGDNISLATSDGINHNTNFTSVAIGIHIIDIFCKVPGNTAIDASHEIYQVIVDDANPTIISSSANTSNSGCNINGLTINFVMSDDVGIEGYSYYIDGPDITNTLTTVHSNNTNGTIVLNSALQPNKIYTVSIIAVDLTGKTSATATIPITATIGRGANPCGNGCQEAGEECDGADLNSQTCKSLFFGNKYTGGVLGCNNDCTFDFTKCDTGNGWCGDNKVQGPNSNGVYEQCDGSIRSGLTCKLFGFQGGNLACNDNCMVNTSKCIDTTTSGTALAPKCDGRLLEASEQCEIGGNYSVFCSSFGYTGGSISCNSGCMYDLSSCFINTTVPPISGHSGTCGNNIVEGNEKCDGTSGLSIISCKQLGNFTGGSVGCNNNCTYNLSKCVNNVNTCSNGIKDAVETDIDCGGSCPACGFNKTCINNNDCTSGKCGTNGKCALSPCNNNVFDPATESDVDCGKNCTVSCELGKNCLADTDCTSGYCISSICSSDPCTNGVKDSTETDIDCGGNCTTCDVGKACNTNTDCGSGLCDNNVCTQPTPESNPIKLPLMIIGIVMMLGSGGYVIYKTFIAKSTTGGHGGQINGPSGFNHMTENNAPMAPVKLTPEQEEMVKKQHEAMMKRRQERSDERKNVLQKLGDSEDSGIKETIKEKDNTKFDVIKKGNKTSSEKLDNGTNEEFVNLSELKGKNKVGKDTFEKLRALNVDATSKKIADISGASQKEIKPALNTAEALTDTDALKMFGEIDRDTIMSGVFKDVLSDLLTSKKITKEHVSNILFEYMDKGLLSKGDVAKLSSELKII